MKNVLCLLGLIFLGQQAIAQQVNYEVRVVAFKAQGDNNDGGGFAGEQDPTFYIWARENILTNWNPNICTHFSDDTWDTWNVVNIPLISANGSNATSILVDMECWEKDACGSNCTYVTGSFTCWNGDDNYTGRVQVGNISFRNAPPCQWNEYEVVAQGSGSGSDYGDFFAKVQIRWEYTNFTAGVPISSCGTAANLNGFGTGTWSITSGGTGGFNDTNDPQTTFLGASAGNYTLTYTTLPGCATQNTATVNVNLLGNPTPDIIANDPGCVGQSIAYTAANGVNYAWKIGKNGPTLQLGPNNVFNSNFVQPGDTVYCVVTDANGCVGQGFYVPNLAPSPSVNLGSDQTICPATSVLLDATQPFMSYLWSTGSTASAISVSAPGTYTVTITNQNNCSATDNVVISNHPAASVNLGNDTTICQGNPFLIDAGAGFSGYLWSTGATSQTISVSSFGTYSVTVTDANGCTANDQIVLTPLINNFQLMNDTTIYLGQPLVISATGGSGYQWSTGASSPSITVSPTVETTYTVTVLYPDGCYDIGTVTVSINDGLNVFIPNMFSPNNDGQNDYFQVYGYGIGDITLNIYNRWGQLVYSENDLVRLQTLGWDGTHEGKEQPSGTYIWNLSGTTVTGLPLQYRDPLTNEVKTTGSILLKR